MTDPRIDDLGRNAILTDTTLRIAFAPADPKAAITALKVPVRHDRVTQMQSLMQLGLIHVQIKPGFGDEKHHVYTGPEVMILLEALDRFVTELPRAQQAKPQEDA